MQKKAVEQVGLFCKRWCSSLSKVQANEPRGPKVLVIGAGLAGLSAADRLLCAGIKEVTVLEATDRIGGRILSGWLGDTQIELGRDSIGPASINNPCYNLAVTLGAELSEQEPLPQVFVNPVSGSVVTSFGPQELLYKTILEEIPAGTKTPLLQYLHMRFQQEIAHFPAEVKSQWEQVLYGLANEARLEEGTDPVTLLAWCVHLRKTPPGRNMKIKSGNSCLMTALASRIPADKIRLNEEVCKVVWGEGVHGAIVKTASGKIYKADFVISTIPVGVLLENGEELFCPELPTELTSALKSINNTARNTVYFEYEEPWWTEPTHLRLGWTMEDLLQDGNWARGINGMETVSNTVFRFNVTGQEAQLLEESTDEEIGVEMTSLLRKMMKDPTLPYPRHVLVTRWGSNKFCKGSYIGVRTDRDALDRLAARVPSHDPAIFFAGDMTIPSLLGKIQGSRISGVREADKILSITGKGPV